MPRCHECSPCLRRIVPCHDYGDVEEREVLVTSQHRAIAGFCRVAAASTLGTVARFFTSDQMMGMRLALITVATAAVLVTMLDTGLAWSETLPAPKSSAGTVPGRAETTVDPMEASSVSTIDWPSRRIADSQTPIYGRAAVQLRAFELELSPRADGFLQRVWRGGRRFYRLLSASVTQWISWIGEAALFVVVAVFAALLDRGLFNTWRERGFTAFCGAATAGVAVYIRLLVDPRIPAIGKSLLLCAVIYAVAPDDLFPDPYLPLGRVDDLIAVALASRGFMRLCPYRIVEEHAANAIRIREEGYSRRPVRRRSAS